MRLGPLSISLDFTPTGVALIYKLHFPQQPAVKAPGPATAGAPITLATAPPVFRDQPAPAPKPRPVELYGEGVISLPEGDYPAVVTVVRADPPFATVAPDQPVPVPLFVEGGADKEQPFGTANVSVSDYLTLEGQVDEAITTYRDEVLGLRGDATWAPTTGKYGKPSDPLAEAEVPDWTPVNPELAAELAAGIVIGPPPPAAAFQLLGKQKEDAADRLRIQKEMTDTTEPAIAVPQKPAIPFPQPTVRPRVRDNPQA